MPAAHRIYIPTDTTLRYDSRSSTFTHSITSYVQVEYSINVLLYGLFSAHLHPCNENELCS